MKSLNILLFLAFAFLSVTGFAQQQRQRAARPLEFDAHRAHLRAQDAIIQARVFTKIAIPLESVILHESTGREAHMYYNQGRLASFGDQTYYMRPLAMKFLSELVKLKYDIVLYSQYHQTVLQYLSNRIQLVSTDGDRNVTISLNQVNSLALKKVENMGRVTAEELGIDPKTTLVVKTLDQKNLDVDFSVNLGEWYLPYSSFSDGQYYKRYISDPAQLQRFPHTAADWERENLKLASLFQVLVLGNKMDQGHFTEYSEKIFSEEMNAYRDDTVKFLNDEIKYIKYTWMIDQTQSKVTGCSIKGLYQRQSHHLSPQECLIFTRSQEGAIDYAFTKPDRSTCAAFTNEFNHIYDTEVEKCQDENPANSVYALFDPQSRIWHRYQAFQGMNQLTQEEVLEVVRRIARVYPTAQNPVRLFQPEKDRRRSANNLLSLQECLTGDPSQQNQGRQQAYRTERWQTMRQNENRRLLEKCQPDTLYSWGDETKLRSLQQQMGTGDRWEMTRGLYTSRGPTPTFGYGDILVRFKIKPGVIFERSNSYVHCLFPLREEQRNKIFFRDDNEYSDWTTCDANVIHSWSHSSPEVYDEIVKDYQKMVSTRTNNQRIVGNIELYYGSQVRANSIFTDSTLDGRLIYSEARFMQILTRMIREIQENRKQIFVHPSERRHDRATEIHFETNRPIHFNEE